MGRYTGSVCKLCRREGVKLFLKGARCYGAKCSVDKRDSPPGMHNWRKGKLSEYGKRLREKQKGKRHYGLFEKQFKNYFRKANKQKGNTGENLLTLLEMRLDSVVFRGGFAQSHPQARQIIAHGHIFVNGRKVDIPSYLIKVGDIITPNTRESSKKMIASVVQEGSRLDVPSWLEKSADNLQLKIVNLPARNEVQLEIEEQLIVEFFSR